MVAGGAVVVTRVGRSHEEITFKPETENFAAAKALTGECMRATRGVDLGGLGSSTARTLLVGVSSRLPSLVAVVAEETIGRSLNWARWW